ncbi:MAG: acyl-CoA reductase [Saprospiraceae bacterium]|nr:acyl-CoA reductase [Saprospiraceae bacterium]
MNKNQRINALNLLRQDLSVNSTYWDDVIYRAMSMNQWFTEKNIRHALNAISQEMLDPDKLSNWSDQYPLIKESKNIGLIMAGNLPLVGFADWLAIFVTGHISKVKCSEKDNVLFPAIIERMGQLVPETLPYTNIITLLKDFDAVIATGSNNSAIYFESYFKNIPHIIRKSRTSVAIIHPDDGDDVLDKLSNDIHAYFGLGCRNVSKIYLPIGYDIQHVMKALEKNSENILFNKYKNNFDYNLSIYMLNKISFYTDNNIILIEDPGLFSRIACLHYQWYDSLEDVVTDLSTKMDEIQCIVSSKPITKFDTIKPGYTQQPALGDYADHVDTMQFLSNL